MGSLFATFYRALTEMLFFSRRIQDPDLGVRLTGKMGRWAVGGLAARDHGPVTGAAPEGRASALVGRVVRECGRQSSVGAFATSRHERTTGSDLFALDGRWKLGPNVVAVGQAMWSRTTTLPSTPAAHGSATNAALMYTGRKTFATAFYSGRPRACGLSQATCSAC